jgi:hypothetical protein
MEHVKLGAVRLDGHAMIPWPTPVLVSKWILNSAVEHVELAGVRLDYSDVIK